MSRRGGVNVTARKSAELLLSSELSNRRWKQSSFWTLRLALSKYEAQSKLSKRKTLFSASDDDTKTA